MRALRFQSQRIKSNANSLLFLSGSQINSLIQNKNLKHEEFASLLIEHVENTDNYLRSYVSFKPEYLIDYSRKLDQAVANGDELGVLSGFAISVKDIFNTNDFATQMGSKLLSNFEPGNDARVVSSLRLDNALITGKTTTAEFAVHTPPDTLNPFDATRLPGTSSTGSAVSVAALMCHGSMCSQTAGSIMRPASYNGVIGFKPTYGLLPRTGVLKTTDTLDSLGFMANYIEDIDLMFESTRLRGHNYPSLNGKVENFPKKSAQSKWKVGLVSGPATWRQNSFVSSQFQKFIIRLPSSEFDLSQVNLRGVFDDAHEIHNLIYAKCLSYYFCAEFEKSRESLSQSFQHLCEVGKEISTESYAEALLMQNKIAKSLHEILENYDFLIDLSAADEAPLINSYEPDDHSLIYTMCRVPAISLPMLLGANHLPVGVQVIGPQFSDKRLLQFSHYLMENFIEN